MPDTALIAATLGGHRAGDGWVLRCPAHDDRTPSLAVNEDDGVLLVHCHAGCKQGDVIAALRKLGLWSTASGDTGGCGHETRYTLRDIDGTAVAIHVRKDRPEGGKRMRWERPGGASGLGGRRAVDLPLYGVERLVSAAPDATVIVTEGERAADAATSLGLLVVGTVTGAKTTPSDGVLRQLVGRDVVLWPDHDEPGRQHMTRIAMRLHALGVRVRILTWRDARDEGDDAADFVAHGGTREALEPLVAEALPLTDPEALAGSGGDDDGDRAHLAEVPAYPTAALPDPLRSMVDAGERAGLPAEYVGAGGLAALAYCALDCRVVVSDTWVEAPAVWTVALGPASSGKSPGWRYGWGPVWAAENALRAADTVALEDWRSLTVRERGAQPSRTTRVMSDSTTEALVRRLAAAGPQVLAVDELRSWLGGLGRYGAGAAAQRDLGHYLSMWDASAPLAYDRVGGDTSIVAAEPAVAIIGTLQTEDHKLLGGVETGLRARWLPHLWRGVALPRDHAEHAAPEAWRLALERLTRERPRLRLSLAAGARILWEDARTRWHEEGKDASPGFRAATSKADRQAVRVALVLAVGMGATSQVPPAAMVGALALVDYALGVWRALPEGDELVLSRAAERTSSAVDRLAAWLERRPERQATRHNILRAQVGGVRRAEVLDVVLSHYEAVYPGSVIHGESTSRGGRPGTVVLAPRRTDTQTSSAGTRRNSGTHSSRPPREARDFSDERGTRRNSDIGRNSDGDDALELAIACGDDGA